MSSQPLVSIVTPCYNGEEHVSRLIESVLEQTCTDAEFILVNDGSTDATEDVVMSYRRDLESTLRGFTYVKQKNQGLGGAINAGLQRVSGRYLVWPDADDFLEPSSLAMRAAILDGVEEYAVVTSDAHIRNEADLGAVLGRVSETFPRSHEPWQFDLFLNAQSIFTAGTHMARMDAFDATHPGRRIFPARRGQNFQMLLPLYYRYPRFYLDVPLYNYVARAGSMSRDTDTLEQELRRWDDHNETLRNTIDSIDMTTEDRARYEELVAKIYDRDRLASLCRYGELQGGLQQLSKMARAKNIRTADLRRVLKALATAVRRPNFGRTEDAS